MFDPSKMDLDLNNLDKKDSLKNNKINKENERINEKEIDNSKKEEDNTKKSSIGEKVDIFSENNYDKKTGTHKKTEENKEKEDKEIKNKSKKEGDKKNSNNEEISNEDKVINNGKNNNNFNDNKEVKEEKIIFDININSLEYLIKYLISKEYDFFTLEPEDNKVKVGFRKDNIEKEVKYIKFPIYTNILLKAKALTKLKIEETSNSQEGKSEINLAKKIYKVLSKTVASDFGEKLFFKVSETEKKVKAKKKEKMSIGKMMSIFAGLLFTASVMGAVFIAIVLFNSNSVSDLQFFNNLGVNTNLIKDFAAKLVNGIFGFIILIEVIFLFIFSYKALLTKKEFKQKRITNIIISILFLILSTITFITWIFLSQKINSLKGINYGKIEFYDNSKLISKVFDEDSSKIDIEQNIIGPIIIRFDNKEYIQKLIDDGFSPDKVVWKIGKDTIEKPIKDYELIYNFDKKGLTDVKLIVEGINIKGEKDEEINEIGKININNIVEIEELRLDNGGSKFIFNASDLEYLGKIKWYYIPSLEGKTDNETSEIIAKALKKEKLEGYEFNSKNIFEGEEYYGIKIIKSGIEEENLDKVFIISKGDKSKISGNIETKQDIDNENKFELSFKNPQTNIGEAYITKYIWEIQDFDNNGDENIVSLEKDANLVDLENSSKVSYTFKKSGVHKVSLTIINSEGKEEYFEKEINISKKVGIKTNLNFSINNKELDYKKDIKYQENDNIYNIENIGAPSTLDIDAKKIKSINPKYWLKNVSWDLDNDGNFEEVGQYVSYDINTSGNHTIKVKYSFENKNNKDDIINLVETIYITANDKESILNLKIIKPNSYVPVVIGFDATNSKVTGENIDKFIFDYGDGTPPEERDGKNTGHKYIEPGDYTVKLTVITETGKKYGTERKLTLKSKPQKAVIKTSLKKAPTYQEINFSAENSIGEIATYFWDLGDGTTSTQMNLNHFYKKAGTYQVELILESTNRNQLKDKIEIEIYEE